MPPPVPNVLYTLRVGQALSLGFSTSIRNLIPFAAMALLIYVPWIAALVLLPTSADPEHPGGGLMILFLTFVLPVLLNNIVTGEVTFGVVQQLRGKRARFADCLSQGFASLGRVLGTGFLAGLRIFFFYLLLIVPGVIETCRLAVAVPVTIAERAGPGASVQRSIELTRGSRLPIFGMTFVIGIANYALGAIAGIVTKDMGLTAIIIGQIVAMLWSSVWTASSYASAYFLLRKGKENLGIEELALVFA
jgi:hypothetical protein